MINWDKTHTERARVEGWNLITTIDNGTTHPYYMVGRTANSALASDLHASQHVLDMARQGGPIHRHALHIVMQSRLKPTTKGTRK